MNHDATHCSDYRNGRCPKECYRAQLTQNLRDDPYRFLRLPVSWANFKGTNECPMKEEVSE